MLGGPSPRRDLASQQRVQLIILAAPLAHACALHTCVRMRLMLVAALSAAVSARFQAQVFLPLYFAGKAALPCRSPARL